MMKKNKSRIDNYMNDNKNKKNLIELKKLMWIDEFIYIADELFTFVSVLILFKVLAELKRADYILNLWSTTPKLKRAIGRINMCSIFELLMVLSYFAIACIYMWSFSVQRMKEGY